MSVPPRSLKELFLAVLEVAPEDRAAWLERECAADDGLREHLRLMLAAHDAPQSLLDQPVATLAASSPRNGVSATVEQPLTEGAGTAIGPYKLLQLIGEGGMGTVWMAEQTAPVKRVVALKVIKAGMDSRQVLARFGAERQALALMDHPNIAKVLDAGATERGRPYFVMELVKGVPITRYCDEKRLTPRERLELFIPVCQAVQHAHQKGIIHRDLKPSNILVGLYDGKPVPKVIDFGVAKAAGPKLTEATLFTGIGTVIGTPEYMSPEQAQLDNLDIDTRSDIYSLGVLLYELLTGTTPFTKKDLVKAGMLEMLRVIREQEPTKPSTKLSTAEGLPTLAANRGTEPARLTKLVRGELDWIVMKALEKDRNRRYETANGLATDLRRYLDDEPVQACPPSARYRLGKFARRNRTVLVTTALVAMALVAGTAISIWQAIRATRAEADAHREADKAIAINEFLAEDLIMQASPYVNAAPQRLTLLEVLDRAAERVEPRFRAQPLLEAAIRYTIGEAYTALGAGDKGRPHLSAALEIYQREKGPWAIETANAMALLGESFKSRGQASRSEPLLRQALPILRRKLGEGHHLTLRAMIWLGVTCRMLGKMADAEMVLSEAVEVGQRIQGPDYVLTVCAMTDLAYVYAIQGKLAKAEHLAVKSLEVSAAVREDQILRGWALEVLTRVYEAQGRQSEVEVLVEKSQESLLARYEGALGDFAAQSSSKLNALAWFLATCPVPRLRDPARAVELSRRAVELAPNAIPIRNTLGVALYRSCDWKAATEALERTEGMAPDKHLAFNGFFLAMAQWQLGHKDEARAWYDRAVEWMDKHGPKNEELQRFRAEAEELLKRAPGKKPDRP